MPFSGAKRTRIALVRKQTQLRPEPRSLSVKKRWPDDGRVRLLISPSTSTSSNSGRAASALPTRVVSSVTVYGVALTRAPWRSDRGRRSRTAPHPRRRRRGSAPATRPRSPPPVCHRSRATRTCPGGARRARPCRRLRGTSDSPPSAPRRCAPGAPGRGARAAPRKRARRRSRPPPRPGSRAPGRRPCRCPRVRRAPAGPAHGRAGGARPPRAWSPEDHLTDEDVDGREIEAEHAPDGAADRALHRGADGREVGAGLHHDPEIDEQAVIAKLNTGAAVGDAMAQDPVDRLAAGAVHGVDAVDLERGERRDPRDHVVGDAGRTDRAAAVTAATDLERLRGIGHQTRSTYFPVRVSTRIRSSWLTKSGTSTTSPVSTVAGLNAALAVSPLKPGSVAVTVSSTDVGRSTPRTLPS